MSVVILIQLSHIIACLKGNSSIEHSTYKGSVIPFTESVSKLLRFENGVSIYINPKLLALKLFSLFGCQ